MAQAGWQGRMSLACAILVLTGCSSFGSGDLAPSKSIQDAEGKQITQLEVQALVMGMADAYSLSIAEAMSAAGEGPTASPRSRWLAMVFLRNGMGAAIDIAATSNPSVALLDLLVLAKLQRWAFETHWMHAGFEPMARRQALQRLTQAEEEMWRSAGSILSAEQATQLEGFIEKWTSENPDRTAVSLVRFEEFRERRRAATMLDRDPASGLLQEVENAATAVEDATLLGERALWFLNRLPFILGHEIQATAFKMATQPEAKLVTESLTTLSELGSEVSARLSTLDADLEEQRLKFGDQIQIESQKIVAELGAMIERERILALDRVFVEVSREREATINQAFDKVADERQAILRAIEDRTDRIQPALEDLRESLAASKELTNELPEVVAALDRVLLRFDRDPSDGREPLRIKDLTLAAREATEAAKELQSMLQTADQLLSSDWDKKIEGVDRRASDLIHQVYRSALILLLILLAGLVILRLIPKRSSRG